MLLALPNNSPGEFLTLAEVRELSGFGTGTVRRAIRNGRLHASQPNGPRGRLLVAADALEAWLSSPPDRPVAATEATPSQRKLRDDLIGPDFDEQSIREFAQRRGA